MSDIPPEVIYKDIKKRVKQRYDRRKDVFTHFASYAFTMFVFWGVFLTPNSFGSGLFGTILAVISVFWTLGLLIHVTQSIFDELADRQVEREMRRAGIRTHYEYETEKIKNEELFIGISDDGELIGMDDADDYDDQYMQAE